MTELVATKIVPPRRRPDLLDRPRLLDTLLENIHKRLIVVSAPAGYGKTSLLVDFAHQLDNTVCWYTVTESDRNLWAFARYIVGAIRQQIPTFGEHSLQRIKQEADDQDALIITLVNEIQALGLPLWLIMDDFHLVGDSPEVKRFLGSLIPLLPDSCHLIIATRTVPDLGPAMVARLVASREVIGIGREDLRFTPEEVWAFLHDVYDHDISRDEARALAEASEGWITAIVLTGQAGDPLAGIARARSAGGRLYDYLASEVLSGLSAHSRDFLMESSVLTEMEPSVVNALLGVNNARTVLDSLEQNNIFVSRLDDQGGDWWTANRPRVWYRYHSLFREFLQTRLRETKPQRYRDLQQRAAYVLSEAGHREQAIDHFLRAGAFEEAAFAIHEETKKPFTTALADQVSRWIDALPNEVLERHPRLLRFRAKAHTERDGDPARAVDFCTRAERIVRREDRPRELAWVLVEKAVALRIQGNFRATVDHCKEALGLVPEGELSLVAEAQRNLGLAQAQLGELEEGVAALRTALDLWQQADNRAGCALGHQELGAILHMMGNLTAADLHFRKALEIWDEINDVGRAVMTLNNLALIYHNRGQYSEALREYRQALQRAGQAASRRYGAFVLIGMGDVYRDLGRYTDAVDAYKRGLLDARKVGDAFLGAYGLDALGQTYHLMGDTHDGIALIRRAYEDARERGAEYEMALYQLSLGAIAHEQGFLDDATNRLKHCIEHFEQARLQELAKANLHLAQTHHLAYRPQGMRECIRATELCLFRLGYDGFILPTVLRTAGAIQAGSDTSPYLGDLLEKAEKKLGPAPDTARRAPTPPLRVHALGQPRVYLGDVLLANDEWSRQRVQELFFYLLTHPHRTTHQIGADLWPDLGPSKVRNNIYVTVSRLRRALGNSDYVISEDGRYSLRIPQLWVDVNQFREAIELARSSPDARGEIQQLERAVSLYRGEFLKDLPVSGDDAWIHEARADLEHLCDMAFGRLVDYWSAQDDARRARQYRQLRSELVPSADRGVPDM